MKPMVIGVVVSGIVEEYSISLINGIEHEAKKDDVKVVVLPGKYLDMNYEQDLFNKYGYTYNSLYSYANLPCVDGLIIEMASITMYTEKEKKEQFANTFNDKPHVFISYDKEGYSSVTIDNKAGLREALEYMYKNGARKFAMLGGPDTNVDALERKQCFKDFLKDNNLPDSDTNYIQGSFFLDSVKEAEELILANPDAEVFVCANDILARRMYNALSMHNIKPGEDVSVLGFDDSDFCISTYPTIASVRTDFIELGKASYRLLRETMAGNKPRKEAIPSKFVLRDSIIHRADNYIASNHDEIKGIIKSNVLFEDYEELDDLCDTISELFSTLDNKKDDYKTIIEKIKSTNEYIFNSDSKENIDWELFINLLERKYKAWIASIEDESSKSEIMSLYLDFLKRIMKVNSTNREQRGVQLMDTTYKMEAFFRDTMQFSRNTDSNYAKFFENIEYMGINNAFLFTFEEPIVYIQGEMFDIPEYVQLKACLKNGEIYKIPANSQKIKGKELFSNSYLDWAGFNMLYILPLYGQNYLYGAVASDMSKIGFSRAELYINQVSASIQMLQLRIENNKIMNEYEESVRKLKEYNITLDNMSKTDPLTGLNNRRGFYVRVERSQCPNDNYSMLVGYVDMNDLKIINDRFGHDDGDFALKTIGSILTDYVTMYNGFAARIGGDEFAFVIPVPKNSDTTSYRAELEELFTEFNKNSLKPYNVAVSVGFCLINKGDNISIDDALNMADELLYTEKRNKKVKVIKN